MPQINTNQTTTVVEATKLVRLSYLQTIAALDNQSTLNSIAGATQGSNQSFNSTDPGSPGFLGIGGEGASNVSSSFNDTGWSISRTWLETWWDKIRWAIGLKEIGIYSFSYAESSEIVSVPFKSPNNIKKVSLKVDEQIPNNYPSNSRWIHYFITIDNGNSWHAINPLDKPTAYSDGLGNVVPRILTFTDTVNDNNNSKYINTNKPVKEIRFRAVLLKPIGEEFKNTTPILKSYRLMIYREVV